MEPSVWLGLGRGCTRPAEPAVCTDYDWKVWAAVWRAEAAWLEGARINGVKGGERERLSAIEAVRDGFESGNDKIVLFQAIDTMERVLAEAQCDGDPGHVLK